MFDKSNGGLNVLEQIGHALIGEVKDKPQLVKLLRDAQLRDVISSETLSMIEGVMEVTDTQVREVMVPRSQMTIIERHDNVEKILSIIIESAHSRFPVIGDNRDDIEGILLAKDMLTIFLNRKNNNSQTDKQFLNEEFQTMDLREYMRPAVFIPESKRLNVLLRDFRSNRNHMAMVVDEYGGVSGLVTIEDVLEEIVGEIEDEHDVDEDSDIVSHGKGAYSVQALTEVNEFNDFFGSDISHDRFDTIGGVIMNAFGYIPQRGEEVELKGFLFKVTHADHRRILSLRLIIAADTVENG
ncbi:MAG: CBS domain-containing protein [gamma proteobacterium symbiont of Taylorina sp.]|nr:CBS domain-containing protein [gamma proteobacterium symbiont of Taylorina sp.]